MSDVIQITIEEAEEAVELTIIEDYGAALGRVPAGGSTGKILAKASGTDFDCEWVTAPEGTGGEGGGTTLTVVGGYAHFELDDLNYKFPVLDGDP